MKLHVKYNIHSRLTAFQGKDGAGGHIQEDGLKTKFSLSCMPFSGAM